MQKINSFEEVMYLLKSGSTIMIVNGGGPCFFALKDGKVKVISKQSGYLLNPDEFKELFGSEVFYEYEPKKREEVISAAKDEEYYSWKHK